MPLPRSIAKPGSIAVGACVECRRTSRPASSTMAIRELSACTSPRTASTAVRRTVSRSGDALSACATSPIARARRSPAAASCSRARASAAAARSCSATASTSVTPVDSGRAPSPRSTARAMPTSAPTAFAIRRPKMKARRPAMAAAAAAPASICQTKRRNGPSTASTGAVRTTRQPENGAVAKAT